MLANNTQGPTTLGYNTLGQPQNEQKRQEPLTLDGIALEVAKKTQAPVALVQQEILASVSAAAIGSYDLETPNGQTGSIGSYHGTIAESGDGKTAVNALVARPIFDFERQQEQRNDGNAKHYEAKHKTWKIKEKYIEKQLKELIKKDKSTDEVVDQLERHLATVPKPPKSFKMRYSTFTPEALVQGMANSWPHAFVSCDEGSSFLKNLTAEACTVLIKCWDGEDILQERSTKGLSRHLQSPRLAMHVSVQPKAFEAFISSRGDVCRDNGFLARWNIVVVQSMQGLRNHDYQSMETPLLDRLHARMIQWLQSSIDENGNPTAKVRLQFASDAKVRLNEISREIERMLLPGGLLEQAKEHGSKKFTITMRLAALIHLIESDSAQEPISLQSLLKAWELSNFYSQQYLNLLVPPSQTELDANALYAWLSSKAQQRNCRYILLSDALWSASPIELRKKERLQPALALLMANGAIRGPILAQHILIDLNPMAPDDMSTAIWAINDYKMRRMRKKDTPAAAQPIPLTPLLGGNTSL